MNVQFAINQKYKDNICATTILLLIFTILIGIAHADSQMELHKKSIPDSAVRQFLNFSLDNIHQKDCGDKYCEKASDEEYNDFPVRLEVLKTVMAFATSDALNKWCFPNKNTKIQKSANYVEQQQMNTRQVLMSAMLYSEFYKAQYKTYTSMGTCSEEIKQKIQ